MFTHLGVILFEMVTGELPFRGTTQMLVQQTLLEEAPSLRKLNSARAAGSRNDLFEMLGKRCQTPVSGSRRTGGGSATIS